MYAYILPLLSLPLTPLHPTHLGHHRAPSWAPWAIQQLPASYLFYIIVYLCQCWSLNSSPSLPPHPVFKVHSSCLCLYSFPANRFIRFFIYVLICDVFLWLTSLCKTSSRLIHITSTDSVSLEWIQEVNLILNTVKLLD